MIARLAGRTKTDGYLITWMDLGQFRTPVIAKATELSGLNIGASAMPFADEVVEWFAAIRQPEPVPEIHARNIGLLVNYATHYVTGDPHKPYAEHTAESRQMLRDYLNGDGE